MKTTRVALALCVLTGWLSAGVIFSENFEGGTGGEVLTGILTGTAFQVTDGNVDLLAPSNPYASLCGTNNSCIDTTGSGARGTIETIAPINFQPGLYYLTFSLQGWNLNNGEFSTTATIRVTLGSLVDETISVDGLLNPYGPARIGFEVLSEQNLTLRFQDLSGSAGWGGAILDDIEIGTAVPEPASLLLVMPALAGLLWARKRGAPGNR